VEPKDAAGQIAQGPLEDNPPDEHRGAICARGMGAVERMEEAERVQAQRPVLTEDWDTVEVNSNKVAEMPYHTTVRKAALIEWKDGHLTASEHGINPLNVREERLRRPKDAAGPQIGNANPGELLHCALHPVEGRSEVCHHAGLEASIENESPQGHQFRFLKAPDALGRDDGMRPGSGPGTPVSDVPSGEIGRV
jgi:hypothetical protein